MMERTSRTLVNTQEKRQAINEEKLSLAHMLMAEVILGKGERDDGAWEGKRDTKEAGGKEAEAVGDCEGDACAVDRDAEIGSDWA